MVQTPRQTVTLEEFLKLPETKPASEYIDNQIIQKPMPQGKHSRVQGKLVATINQLTEAPKIAIALPELRCTFGGRSIVPDIAVFAWSRIPKDEQGEIANVFEGTPDWMIEILSPDQSPTKPTNKILHALRHGTQMGWLIDPAEKIVIVYPQGQQPDFFDLMEQVIWVPALVKNLQLTVGEVFGWLQL